MRISPAKWRFEQTGREDVWYIGYRAGALEEEWMLLFPGEYMLADDQALDRKLPAVPAWVIRDYKHANPREQVQAIGTVATGWPFRAMNHFEWSGYFYPPGVPMSKSTRKIASGYGHGWHVRDFTIGQTSMPMVVPLRPIWPGLAADVAIWTVVSMVLNRLIVQCRRWWRRRRGACAACAYARAGLAADAPCPECGAGFKG